VVVRNQEHLAPAPRTPDIRGYEAQDVVVPHQHSLQHIEAFMSYCLEHNLTFICCLQDNFA
jgi:hypothetical protein